MSKIENQTMNNLLAGLVPPLEPNTILLSVFENDTKERVNQARLNLAVQCKKKLESFAPELNRRQKKMKEASEELKRKRAEFKQRGEQDYQKPINRFVFGFLLCFIAPILELPLNAASLDFLRLAELESYMLAAFFAIVNVFGAKCAARTFRQAALKWEANWAIWSVWLIFTLFCGSFIWVIAELGDLRGLLADKNNRQTMNSGDIFFHLQFVFFIAVVFVSFFQTHPSEIDEQLSKQIASLRRQLHQDWKVRVRLAVKFNKTLEVAQFQIKSHERWGLSAISEYRDGNMFRRSTPPPFYWKYTLTENIFLPIDLGQKIDLNPNKINDILNADE